MLLLSSTNPTQLLALSKSSCKLLVSRCRSYNFHVLCTAFQRQSQSRSNSVWSGHLHQQRCLELRTCRLLCCVPYPHLGGDLSNRSQEVISRADVYPLRLRLAWPTVVGELALAQDSFCSLVRSHIRSHAVACVFPTPAGLYRLLPRRTPPYWNRTNGTGSRARVTNARSDTAHYHTQRISH